MGELWHQVLSIISTVAWCSEGIIQLIENCRLRNLEGYSINYFLMACTSSLFYSVYSTVGYLQLSTGAGTVLLGDFLFANINTMFLVIQSVQFCVFPHGKNAASGYLVLFLIFMWLFLCVNTVLIEFVGVIQGTEYWNPISIMGYGKLVISFIKYIPAIYWNYQRKSTKGWPVLKVMMDFLGGALSLISGSAVDNGLNIAKVGLGILTLFYNLIFMLQAFILYPSRKKTVASQPENVPMNTEIYEEIDK